MQRLAIRATDGRKQDFGQTVCGRAGHKVHEVHESVGSRAEGCIQEGPSMGDLLSRLGE